jgi:hypothetical protein
MKVHVIEEPERRTWKVYVEHQQDGGKPSLFESNGEFIEVRPGEEPPLYARIRQEIGLAFAEAIAPKPHATERHLDDAIMVRDRLLKIVEES